MLNLYKMQQTSQGYKQSKHHIWVQTALCRWEQNSAEEKRTVILMGKKTYYQGQYDVTGTEKG